MKMGVMQERRQVVMIFTYGRQNLGFDPSFCEHPSNQRHPCSKECWCFLFIMIFFTLEDGHCPVKLFNKKQAYHLVGKSHF